jgi:hypothetical protein
MSCFICIDLHRLLPNGEFKERIVWGFSARNVPLYAYWASKLLTFSNRIQGLGPNLRAKKLLNYLKSQRKLLTEQKAGARQQ